MPTFTPKRVDPSAGPVAVKLKPHDLAQRGPKRVLRGRILDPNGNGVAGAVISPYGMKTEGGRQFGGLDGFDPLAVTNDKGEFALGLPEAKYDLDVDVRVQARYLAPGNFRQLAPGRAHDLKLSAGATVTGRLLRDGKPVAGVAMGLVQTNRDVETFLGEQIIGTDEKGQFQFSNVPEGHLYVLYGKMDSCKAHGAVPARELRIGKDDAKVEAGDLVVEKGCRLAGRVELSDGKPLPANTRMYAGRDRAWDSQIIEVAADGSFAVEGLPAGELLRVSARVKGYCPSADNPNVNPLSPTELTGRLKGDLEGFRIVLAPGEPKYPDYSKLKGDEYDKLWKAREKPLRGAPPTQGSKQ